MLQVTDIPSNDIINYLILNDQYTDQNEYDAYNDALNLIYSGNAEYTPPAIADWIIALNLQEQNLEWPSYEASLILTTPDDSLYDLSKILLLDNVDKERIIRILGYLGHLNNDMNVFDNLPVDMMKNIILYLDCKTILLICKLSSKFSTFCQSNLDDLLRENLHRATKFDTTKYNKQKLTNLCKLSKKNYINTGSGGSFVFKDNGQIYVFGFNGFGNLGLGDTNNRYTPTLMPKFNNIIQISSGGNHTLFLTNMGDVYSLGVNSEGQLGLGDKLDRLIPTLITSLTNIVQIAVGYEHSLVLTNTNKLYAFGSNTFGQLGLGNQQNKFIPTLVESFTQDNIIQISLGDRYSLVLLNTGYVYVCGSNVFGSLGLGDKEERYVLNFRLNQNLSNIFRLSNKENSVLALSNDGHVYAFGENTFGELGLGDTEARYIPEIIPNLINIAKISSGNGHSLLLTNTGQVYACGSNTQGELGLGNIQNKNKPILIPKINNIVDISASWKFSIVLSDNGQVFGFGLNNNGQLGLSFDVFKKNIPTYIMSIY